MIVVDASVIVKWFIPEVGDVPAKALLATADELIAPELARIEVASALVRKGIRQELAGTDVENTLRDHPEVVEAWSVTGEPDAIARVRTQDNADLERLIMDLQRDGLVVRTRSQVILSDLVERGSDRTPS